MKKTIVLLLTLFPLLGLAAKPKKTKDNLHYYVAKVSEMTSKKYLMDKKLKGTVYVTKNWDLDADNADQFISRALFLNGYTRVPLKDEEGFMVINSRDVRYNPVPQYTASKVDKPSVPHNYDYFQLSYLPENPQASLDFTTSIRPFLSRYGRIIVVKHNGALIIQDTGLNLHRIYNLLLKYDTPISKELRDAYHEESQRAFELKKLQASSPKKCHDTPFDKGKGKRK